ncbi:hypothetical protein B0H16DRAFT_1486884 [Mycena metata]|uniref:Uncharacterized protein n=1 Tax=Mycena metata TaxID=1033252 RepID=A0AAD7DIT5_9AGAR|nr:hypothetical protein B0H16DRAFT_1486884 [Mycena metata]
MRSHSTLVSKIIPGRPTSISVLWNFKSGTADTSRQWDGWVGKWKTGTPLGCEENKGGGGGYVRTGKGMDEKEGIGIARNDSQETNLQVPLGGSLAPRVRSLLQPNGFEEPAKIPLNFDLPIYGATPPYRLHFEMYPYSAAERAAITPFCFQPFVRIFSILHNPFIVTPDREAALLPHVACAMEFFTNWIKNRPDGTRFPPMQQHLFVSLCRAIQGFTQDRRTAGWLKTIPGMARNPFQNRLPAWPGLRTLHDPSVPRVCQTSTRCKLPPYVPPIETLAPLESSPPARCIKEEDAVEKTPPTRFNRKPRSFSEMRLSPPPVLSHPSTSAPQTPMPKAVVTPPLFHPPPEQLFSPGSNDKDSPYKASVDELQAEDNILPGSPIDNDIEMPAVDDELNIPLSPTLASKGKGKAASKTGPPKRGKSTAPKGAPVSSPERPSKWPRHTMEVVIPRDSALHTHAVRSSTVAADSTHPEATMQGPPSPRSQVPFRTLFRHPRFFEA